MRVLLKQILQYKVVANAKIQNVLLSKMSLPSQEMLSL
jgi:hypothetical protein